MNAKHSEYNLENNNGTGKFIQELGEEENPQAYCHTLVHGQIDVTLTGELYTFLTANPVCNRPTRRMYMITMANKQEVFHATNQIAGQRRSERPRPT